MSQRIHMCSLLDAFYAVVFVFTKIMSQSQIDKRGKKTEGGSSELPKDQPNMVSQPKSKGKGPAHTAHLLKTAQNITARPDPTPAAVLLIVYRAYARFWTAQCVWLADGCCIFCINGCRLSGIVILKRKTLTLNQIKH